MSPEAEKVRTPILDSQAITDLCSPIEEIRNEVIAHLPDVLSIKELRNIGQLVIERYKDETKDTRQNRMLRAVFDIGVYALYTCGDLATAESAKSFLFKEKDIAGWAILRKEVRKAKKNGYYRTYI